MTEYQLHTQGARHTFEPPYDCRDPMRNRTGIDTMKKQYDAVSIMMAIRAGMSELDAEALVDRIRAHVTHDLRRAAGIYDNNSVQVGFAAAPVAEVVAQDTQYHGYARAIRCLRGVVEPGTKLYAAPQPPASAQPVELDWQGSEPFAWAAYDAATAKPVFTDDDMSDSIAWFPLFRKPQPANPVVKESLTVAEPVKVPSDGLTKEVVSRILGYAGKTRRQVSNPYITANETIWLANWLTAILGGQPAQAAAQPSVPDGWKLMPVEAAPGQVARVSQFDIIHNKHPHGAELARELYKAFIETAPTPSADGQAQQDANKGTSTETIDAMALRSFDAVTKDGYLYECESYCAGYANAQPDRAMAGDDAEALEALAYRIDLAGGNFAIEIDVEAAKLIRALLKRVQPASVAYTLPPFPTMLRKMWSGGEVQAWIDQNIKPASVEDAK